MVPDFGHMKCNQSDLIKTSSNSSSIILNLNNELPYISPFNLLDKSYI